MSTIPGRRAAGALVIAVLTAATALVMTAGTAGAVNVATEAQFRTAFANAAETNITLTADITLTCPGGNPSRVVGGDLVIDGNGHTLRQTCADGTSLTTVASGDLTVTNLTITGGASGITSVASGPLTVTDSAITDLIGSGSATGITAVADESNTVSNTTISGVTGDTANGVIAVVGGLTFTSSSTSDLVADPSGATALTVVDVGVSSAEIVGSTVSGTSGTTNAAGLVSVGTASTALTDSAILDTTGPVAGGIVHVGESSLETTRSTVAGSEGLGVLSVSDAGPSLENSTITQNGGGLMAVTGEGATTDFVYSDIVENGPALAVSGAPVPDLAPEVEALATEEGVDLSAYEASQQLDLADAAAEATPQQEPAQVNVVGGTFNAFGTVIAVPQDGAVNCDLALEGDVTSAHDFSDDDTCELTGEGDRENAGDPELGALADNGGPTPTLLPADTSPLVNAIPLDHCQDDGASGIETDQRLLPRPAETGCEVGSVEIQPPPEPEPAPGPVAAPPPFTG